MAQEVGIIYPFTSATPSRFARWFIPPIQSKRCTVSSASWPKPRAGSRTITVCLNYCISVFKMRVKNGLCRFRIGTWPYLSWPSSLKADLMVHLICDEIDQVFLRWHRILNSLKIKTSITPTLPQKASSSFLFIYLSCTRFRLDPWRFIVPCDYVYQNYEKDHRKPMRNMLAAAIESSRQLHKEWSERHEHPHLQSWRRQEPSQSQRAREGFHQ